MKKRFKKVYIEITNVCNLACKFCPPTSRKKEFMSVTNFKDIINSVKDYTNLVYLHLRGEPLMHPNIEEILDICEENNIKVNITTNATLIDKLHFATNQNKALRQVNYSLHSLEENNISSVKEYMDKVISFINSNPSVIHSLRFWNLSNDLVKNKEVIDYLKREFNISEDVFNLPSYKIRDNLYLNQEEEFTWPNINNDVYSPTGFCYGLRDQIGILVNGDVVPCCLDSEGSVVLGNINKSSIEEIINSKKALDIYNGFSNRMATEELCIHCNYKDRF